MAPSISRYVDGVAGAGGVGAGATLTGDDTVAMFTGEGSGAACRSRMLSR